MVYITNSNFKLIEKNIDLKEWKVDKNNLDSKIKNIFSEFEQKEILFFKMLSKSSNEDLRELEKIAKKKDKSPAYHYSLDCEYMYHDYKGIKLPDNLEKCNVKKEVYKDWFDNNKTIFTKNYDLFMRLQIEKFGLELNYPTEKIKENTGSTIYSNKDAKLRLNSEAKEILNKIIQITPRHFSGLEIAGKSFQATSYYKKEPSLFIKEHIEEFKEVHKLKMKLKNIMKEYYFLDKNPESNYEGELLKKLGFHPCKVCCKNNYI